MLLFNGNITLNIFKTYQTRLTLVLVLMMMTVLIVIHLLMLSKLDWHFTYYEVIKTICNMNKHKRADIDGNVIDFFIDAKEFITPYLVTMFNLFLKRVFILSRGEMELLCQFLRKVIKPVLKIIEA